MCRVKPLTAWSKVASANGIAARSASTVVTLGRFRRRSRASMAGATSIAVTGPLPGRAHRAVGDLPTARPQVGHVATRREERAPHDFHRNALEEGRFLVVGGGNAIEQAAVECHTNQRAAAASEERPWLLNGKWNRS